MQPDITYRIRQEFVKRNESLHTESIAQIVREIEPNLSRTDHLALLDAVMIDAELLGPLSKLSNIPELTDILVNSHDEVWIDSGKGLERVEVSWRSEQELREFASRLAGLVNRRLDDSQPWVDAQLPNGFRFHAVIPPLSVGGTTLSFRKPAKRNLSLQDLVAVGSLSVSGHELLQQIVHQQRSFIICGGTGTGKTTILNAMLNYVGQDSRLVIIEDSVELQLTHPHVVNLQTRSANAEGIGEVSLQTLVRQALRMRPDRLILGEVRGVEVLDLLLAVNTGHQGSAVTVHANSGAALPLRFEALGLLASMPRESVHAQLAAGFHFAIETTRSADYSRRLGRLYCLALRHHTVHMEPVQDLCSGESFSPGMRLFEEALRAQ